MSTLKVNTVLSADTPTVNITDGLSVSGVSTLSSGLKVGTAATIYANGNVTCGIITTTNIVNSTQLSHRNIVINGAMTVAQRGTSSTSSGYYTVDRFQVNNSGTDEAPTQAQVDVAAGTTPYELGFRKALKVTNGNQTSGAGAADFIRILYYIEAQDLANSGWNYKSSSSYITLSFWVKSSVAQTYYTNFRVYDGTQQMYYFSYALSADTWTKVTKTIPGNSNITIDNDNGKAMYIQWYQYRGTDNTGTVTADQWNTLDTSTFTPDQTTTWYTTNDATFEITGVQLEVGSVATPYEHRSYGDELNRCYRYYYQHVSGTDNSIANATLYQDNNLFPIITFPVRMRAEPSLDVADGSGYFTVYSNGGNDGFDTFSSIWNPSHNTAGINAYSNDGVSGRSAGHSAMIITSNSSAYLGFSAEL